MPITSFELSWVEKNSNNNVSVEKATKVPYWVDQKQNMKTHAQSRQEHIRDTCGVYVTRNLS